MAREVNLRVGPWYMPIIAAGKALPREPVCFQAVYTSELIGLSASASRSCMVLESLDWRDVIGIVKGDELKKINDDGELVRAGGLASGLTGTGSN
jgi:hypothetical protein